MGRWGRFLTVVMVLSWAAVALLPGRAEAHTLDTQGFSSITQQGDDVRYELLVDYAALAIVAGLGTPGDGSQDDPDAELREGRDRLVEYLDERLHVLVDGLPCEPEITATGIESRFDQPYAKISLRYDCPGAGEHTIQYSVLVGDLDPGHTNVAGYDLGEETGEFIFDVDNTEFEVGEESLLRQVYRFGVSGLEHILGGLDHVLFVVALLIGTRGLREVFGVVTAFTVAHSVTLLAAALDVVRIPASIVEPLIALSIAYVAVTSLLGRSTTRYRLAAVFGFGLLHGLGFAGALGFTGDVSWQSLSSLVSFNVGIEIGQALIVAVLFPFLHYARRFGWSRYVHFAAAGLITLVGLTWFVERLVMA